VRTASADSVLAAWQFHQVVRASTPLFTILISSIFFKGKFTVLKLVSLLPVIAGVGFAYVLPSPPFRQSPRLPSLIVILGFRRTYGDYYFTAWGLILTLLGTFLAALKTVVTNVIQTGGGGRLKLVSCRTIGERGG
jgi:drug/metabolite transporter (DMT)-like permease